MNDFTKEELENILYWNSFVPIHQSHAKLYIKIQSMIDNYCEHPNEDRIFYGDVAVGECKNCHMVIL